MPVKQKFEVIVYNQEVRRLIDEERHHRHLADSWADNHHEEIAAETAEGARAKAERRYPAHQGFVIVEVIPMDEP